MESRRLGTTDLIVSRLGLGLAALGRPGYINLGHAEDLRRQYDIAGMRDLTHGVLDAALQMGVRYFDAARSYGRAEYFLSSWLTSRHIAPDAVTVGSKWGYTYTAGWMVEARQHEVKDHSLRVLARQIAESRGLLDGYLNLYQIHSATLESGVLDDRDVLAQLARLRTEGLKVGLTLSGPGQSATLERAMEIGAIALERLTRMQQRFQVIGDVRGRGAMVAMELVEDRGTKQPAKHAATALIEECYRQGVIILKAGTYDNVIRLLPPLTIKKDLLQEALDVLEEALAGIEA